MNFKSPRVRTKGEINFRILIFTIVVEVLLGLLTALMVAYAINDLYRGIIGTTGFFVMLGMALIAVYLQAREDQTYSAWFPEDDE